jgi:hypothetical protein
MGKAPEVEASAGPVGRQPDRQAAAPPSALNLSVPDLIARDLTRVRGGENTGLEEPPMINLFD